MFSEKDLKMLATADKKYAVAIRLQAFLRAWQQLVEVTAPMEDLDLTDFYPFGYVDFETELLDRVKAWCTYYSNKLFSECPIMVVNPDCPTYCNNWYKAAIDNTGHCTCAPEGGCQRYPLIAFDPKLIYAALTKVGITVDATNIEALYSAYQTWLESSKPKDV